MRNNQIRNLFLILMSAVLLVLAMTVLPTMAEDTTEVLLYEFDITKEYADSIAPDGYKLVRVEGAWLNFNMMGQGTNYFYLGEYDLSDVGTITFKARNDPSSVFKYTSCIAFSKDAAGNEVLSTSKAISSIGWSGGATCSAYLDTDYQGPLYVSFYSAGVSDGYCISAFKFYQKTGNEPQGDETEPEETLAPGETEPKYTFKVTDEWMNSLDSKQIKRVRHSSEWLGEDHHFLQFNATVAGTNYVYIGDYDLSQVSVASFEVTNGKSTVFPDGAEVRFVTSPSCDTVLARASAISRVSLVNPTLSYAVFDTDYSGPVYLSFYSAGSDAMYQVANIKFYATAEDDREFVFPTETTAGEDASRETENFDPVVTSPSQDTDTLTEMTTFDTSGNESVTSSDNGGGCASTMISLGILPLATAVIFLRKRKEDAS